MKVDESTGFSNARSKLKKKKKQKTKQARENVYTLSPVIDLC